MDKKLFISENESPERLDKFLSSVMDGVTRSAAEKYITDGLALLNGNPANKSAKIKKGDQIEITLPKPREMNAAAENIPLDIAYEDEFLLIVNKPKGMVVHPAPGNYGKTLVNALLAHCKGSLSGINGVMRPGIVHRIDKDTSGLLIVAKNDFAHQKLADQIKAHSFKREYEAVACGVFKELEGTVNAPIGRHPVKRRQMAVTDKNSKNAVTHYKALNIFEESKLTHISLRLETGRTHQIRVHMAYINHPLAGDTVYGGKKISGLDGQCLHAKTIGFIHPKTNEYMEFSSELPQYFKHVLNII